MYAALQQEDGKEKLLNNGYTEEELDALTLNEKEMEMYDFMRSRLDALRPRIEEMMRTVYNKELGNVKNYFPYLTDFELLDEADVAERLFEERETQRGVQTKPNMKFTKARVGAGKQKIQVNALGIYLNHMDNALYALNVGPYNEMLSQLAKEEWVEEAIGERGKALLINWLEIIAKKGGIAGQQKIPGLDALRRNFGVATLGFKLSSFAIQPTALLDAGAMIGDYAFKGAGAIINSDQWRKFVMNSSELRNRVGDDPAFKELAKNKAIAKIQELGLKPLQWLDSKTAASTWAGAYMKYLDENGIAMDFAQPNLEAMNYADLILRRTQASPLFKDLPLALSRGNLGEKFANRGIAKILFQFQTFMLTRYSWVRHDMIRMGFGKGDYAKGLSMLLFLNFAIVSEMLIRAASAAVVNGVTGGDDDDEEKNIALEFAKEFSGTVPFISQAVSFWSYGSVPVPAVSALGRLVENITNLKRSESEEKVQKWLSISLADTVGTLGGVPGTTQSLQILKKLFD